jgi:cation transport regulator ChaC
LHLRPGIGIREAVSADVDALWYFGYGSNMSPATFLERREMCPLATKVARLDGFELCFDLPVGPGERGVANLRARSAGVTWGVAYQLRAQDCARLDHTEGVPLGVYDRLDIEVHVLGAARPLAAFTYHSEHRAAGRKPSARYLGILLDGARHHALPATYVSQLEAFELAMDEREQQTKGRSS